MDHRSNPNVMPVSIVDRDSTYSTHEQEERTIAHSLPSKWIPMEERGMEQHRSKWRRRFGPIKVWASVVRCRGGSIATLRMELGIRNTSHVALTIFWVRSRREKRRAEPSQYSSLVSDSFFVPLLLGFVVIATTEGPIPCLSFESHLTGFVFRSF